MEQSGAMRLAKSVAVLQVKLSVIQHEQDF